MSDFGLSFSPLFPWWIVLVVTILVFGLFLTLELKRKQKLLAFRIIALTLLFLSLAGMLLRPSLKTEKKSEVVLLTPGFQKSKVDSLLKQNPGLRIIRTNSSKPFPGSEELRSYQQLSDENIKYIYGEGLSQFALELCKKSFDFLPGEIPPGVVELTVPTIFQNRKNSISGVFSSPHKTKLKLVGPTGAVDSTVLDRGENAFSFSIHPTQSGLFIYSVVSEDSLGNKSTERLPLEVRPEINLRILFIHHFPSAEVRYLKNFLAEKGHSIAVRSQTSKNNFSEEFINTPRTQLNRISSDLLNSFDLILTDSKSLEGFNASEKTALEKSVLSGLGLIVTDATSKKNEFYSFKGKVLSADTAHFSVASKKYVFPALPLDVGNHSALESVLKNKNRMLSGYRFWGAGKIGFLLLQETYRLALEGNTEDYATIWSELIEKIARRENKKFEVKIDTYFPYYTDEPIHFSIISSGEKTVLFADRVKIPISEDVVVDDLWNGKVWAGKSGWHQFKMADSTVLNYFVHKSNEWQSIRASSSRAATLLAQKASAIGGNSIQFSDDPISPVLFYIIFILASGFLWLAPKI